MLHITRTAWERSRVTYEFELTEEMIEEWNNSIKAQNPNFVDLTAEDIADAWTGENSEQSRYLEKIWWYDARVSLFDFICDDINDMIWESEPYVEDHEAFDYYDEEEDE